MSFHKSAEEGRDGQVPKRKLKMKRRASLLLCALLAVGIFASVQTSYGATSNLTPPCEGNNFKNDKFLDDVHMGGPMVGISWTPRVSVTVTRIEVFTGEGDPQTSIALAIWSDDGGSPSKPLANLGNTPYVPISLTNSWQGANLITPVSAAAGANYWVVYDPYGGQQAPVTAHPIVQTYWGSYYGNVESGASWFGPFHHYSWKFRMFCGPLEIPVEIDIKPGSGLNSINVKSTGVIPVAVLTTSMFDANTIELSTVKFGRTGSEASPVRSDLTDVDEDSDLDLILQFNTQDTGFMTGDTGGTLTGKTFEGTPVIGTDSIRAFFPGDANGDLTINVLDLVLVGSAFGSTPESPRYNLYTDFDENAVINILDLVVVGAYFGQHA